MDINGLRDFKQTLVVRGVAQGTVSAAKTVQVRFLGTTITCRAGRGVTTAAGDIVLVLRSAKELTVIERLHAAAPTGASDDLNSYPPNPWNSVQNGSSVIHPVKTRSFREGGNGWRTDTDDLFQGKWGSSNHAGCAFYGKKPQSLLGAEVLTAKIKVKRDAGSEWRPFESTTLKRITQTNLTKAMVKDDDGPDFVTGTVGVDDAITGPKLRSGASEVFDLPKRWGQELVDGFAGGLAIHTNTEHPQARLDGRGSWGPSFTLLLTWRRVT